MRRLIWCWYFLGLCIAHYRKVQANEDKLAYGTDISLRELYEHLKREIDPRHGLHGVYRHCPDGKDTGRTRVQIRALPDGE